MTNSTLNAARAAHDAAVSRLGDADDLVAMVLDVAGAHRLALNALLRLSTIEWDDDVTTACVECSAAPRMLLNPLFVEQHCPTPRALAFLLLHELSHVSFGHTGLNPRITSAQNIAFDAIINASLLQGLWCNETDDGTIAEWCALTASDYADNESPEFILRPPPRWPLRPNWEASAGLPEPLRHIHRRLYASAAKAKADGIEGWQTVTYGELLRALNDAHGAGTGDSSDDAADRLLGAHGQTDTERSAVTGGRDARASELLGEVLVQLPHDPRADRGPGGALMALKLAGEREARLVAALRALLRRSFIDDANTNKRRAVQQSTLSVDASRDRRAHLRRHAARVLGAPAPLMFKSDTEHLVRDHAGVTAIYLDVSGSMGDWVHRLHAALVPLRRLLAPKLFVFSTTVEEYTRDAFVRGRVRTTGGTDITPVLQHLAKQARGGKLKGALLLTDGYVGNASVSERREFAKSGAQLHVGIVGSCDFGTPAWAASVTKLGA